MAQRQLAPRVQFTWSARKEHFDRRQRMSHCILLNVEWQNAPPPPPPPGRQPLGHARARLGTQRYDSASGEEKEIGASQRGEGREETLEGEREREKGLKWTQEAPLRDWMKLQIEILDVRSGIPPRWEERRRGRGKKEGSERASARGIRWTERNFECCIWHTERQGRRKYGEGGGGRRRRRGWPPEVHPSTPCTELLRRALH